MKKIEYRTLTDEEMRDIVDVPVNEDSPKGDKLRLIAVFMQVAAPKLGVAPLAGNVVADLMRWADDADSADHVKDCKNCTLAMIDEALDIAEERYGNA